MCPPLLAALATGTALIPATGTAAAVAATSGLFGAGGAFSLGTTLTTLAAVGGGVSSLMAAQQARANLQYQSSMANYNATVAENEKLAQKYAAYNEAEVFAERFRRLQASQSPKYAAAGVLINRDTPLAVAMDTAEQGYLEKAAILYSGDVKSAAAREAAKVQRYTAATYTGMKKPTMVAGYMSAGTSLLGGLAEV